MDKTLQTITEQVKQHYLEHGIYSDICSGSIAKYVNAKIDGLKVYIERGYISNFEYIKTISNIYDKTIDELKAFTTCFNNYYEQFYNGAQTEKTEIDAVSYFDNEILKNEISFIQAFNEYNNDLISSDREAAAFASAFIDLMAI